MTALSPRRGFIAPSIVILAICVLVTAACGTSSNTSTGGSSNAGASTLTIGVVGSFSGVLASSFGAMPATFTAWEKWTNAHGGVDGHPVRLIIDDDSDAAATSITDIRQLVTNDKVPVIVDASGVDNGWSSYIESQKMPVIAVGGTLYNDYYFPVGTPLSYGSLGSFAVGKAAGGSRLAFLYCADVAACTSYVSVARAAAKAVGVNLTYAAAAASNAPNYTAVCLAAKAANADILNVFGPVSLQVSVANSCAQQNDKFIVVSGNNNFTNYWLKYPALNGALAEASDFPVTYDGNAAAQTYQAAMKKYEPGILTNINYGEGNAAAWVAMQEAAQAVVNDKPGKTATITPSDILDGLYKFKNTTLGGLAPPLTYGPGNSGQNVDCWFTMGIQSQAFTAPDGLKVSCFKGSLPS